MESCSKWKIGSGAKEEGKGGAWVLIRGGNLITWNAVPNSTPFVRSGFDPSGGCIILQPSPSHVLKRTYFSPLASHFPFPFVVHEGAKNF